MRCTGLTPLLAVVLQAVLPGCPGFAAPGPVETNQPGRSAGSSEARLPAEANLPVVFLEAKGPIVSDQRSPCALKIVCPQGQEGGNTVAVHRFSQGRQESNANTWDEASPKRTG
jgi:hypothetical protein